MASKPWCKSIAISPNEDYIAVGFENSTVRLFNTTSSKDPRDYRLHCRLHAECRDCAPVETVSFSKDGAILLASTRIPRTGTIQIYSWQSPFTDFQELSACQYSVPLHESEDNGITSAIPLPSIDLEDSLVCITTWPQSGIPILVHSTSGHRSELKPDASNRQAKLGTRIQCAASSPDGKTLALVNDKGDLHRISNLNSNLMDIRKIATSKKLTAKSDSFSMAYMTLSDEHAIVLAWADASNATGFIKKIPVVLNVSRHIFFWLTNLEISYSENAINIKISPG